MKKLLFVGLLLAIMTGCVNKKPQDQSASDRIKVHVTKVVSASTLQDLRYSGTVEAFQTIPLTFQTTGTVQKVLVESGDQVKKGQVLAIVDESDMQNIYATMLAKFNQAQDAFDRLKQVYDQGSLPEIKWVEMKTNLEQAKASLDLAKNNLEKCRLVAPVDGTVGRRNIEPGQSSLSLTGAAIELVRIEKVNIKISVTENEINQIAKGRKTIISVMALYGRQFTGVVNNISPVAEMMSRTYTVKILVENPGQELKPGMVCDVILGKEKGMLVLVVPYSAVSRDNEGRTFVYIVNREQTSVKKQTVVTGRYNVSGIEITDGLTEGQEIVSGGVDKLDDNAIIEL